MDFKSIRKIFIKKFVQFTNDSRGNRKKGQRARIGNRITTHVSETNVSNPCRFGKGLLPIFYRVR